jgi:uncharacterized membrane protein
MVLPSGFGVPPLPYVVVLLGGTLLVGSILVALKPPIDQRTVLALSPFMALGGALHALSQPPISLYDATFSPMFGTPAVYLTTFILTGFVWIGLELFAVWFGHADTVSRNLGLTGVGILTVLLVLTTVTALRSGLLDLLWPTVAVVASLVLAGATVLGIALWRTPIIIRARYAAPIVVFAHVFDGVSTAIGTDIIGVGERSPVPRAIMEFASTLPTEPVIGSGWLFVAVKVVVASGVVMLMHQYLVDEPVEASLLLSVITAVGLGPATNNFVLFLFTG